MSDADSTDRPPEAAKKPEIVAAEVRYTETTVVSMPAVSMPARPLGPARPQPPTAVGVRPPRRPTTVLVIIGLAVVLVCGAICGVGLFVKNLGNPAHQDTGTDPLLGRWTDEQGVGYAITAAGPGAYRGEVTDNPTQVCTPINMKLSGSNGHYTGTTGFYTVQGCRYVGVGTVTFDIDPGGSTGNRPRHPARRTGALSHLRQHLEPRYRVRRSRPVPAAPRCQVSPHCPGPSSPR